MQSNRFNHPKACRRNYKKRYCHECFSSVDAPEKQYSDELSGEALKFRNGIEYITTSANNGIRPHDFESSHRDVQSECSQTSIRISYFSQNDGVYKTNRNPILSERSWQPWLNLHRLNGWRASLWPSLRSSSAKCFYEIFAYQHSELEAFDEISKFWILYLVYWTKKESIRLLRKILKIQKLSQLLESPIRCSLETHRSYWEGNWKSRGILTYVLNHGLRYLNLIQWACSWR